MVYGVVMVMYLSMVGLMLCMGICWCVVYYSLCADASDWCYVDVIFVMVSCWRCIYTYVYIHV